jgi:hypothetical protein
MNCSDYIVSYTTGVWLFPIIVYMRLRHRMAHLTQCLVKHSSMATAYYVCADV